MPNFWTKTTQKIGEAFNGPRTRDVEFDSKVDEMKLTETAMGNLKNAFHNFNQNTIGLKNMCKDIYGCIRSIFDKKSPYYSIGNDIFEIHIQLEKLYEDLNNNVQNIYSRTSEWSQLFNQAKSLLNQRDEKRKHFDHYDEKLEKLYKNKMEKMRKNLPDTSKEIELLERNETKYKRATEEYINLSLSCYQTMSLVLDTRYKIVNPIITKFTLDEKSFYEKSSDLFKKIISIEQRFTDITNIYNKPKSTYDPCKYIRGGKLVRSKMQDDNDDTDIRKNSYNQVDKSRSKSNYIRENFPKNQSNLDDDLTKINRNTIGLENKKKIDQYKINEFENLDDFLNKKEKDLNNIIATKNENPPLRNIHNVRLSSIENFEKIQNNFSESQKNQNSSSSGIQSNIFYNDKALNNINNNPDFNPSKTLDNSLSLGNYPDLTFPNQQITYNNINSNSYSNILNSFSNNNLANFDLNIGIQNSGNNIDLKEDFFKPNNFDMVLNQGMDRTNLKRSINKISNDKIQNINFLDLNNEAKNFGNNSNLKNIPNHVNFTYGNNIIDNQNFNFNNNINPIPIQFTNNQMELINNLSINNPNMNQINNSLPRQDDLFKDFFY